MTTSWSGRIAGLLGGLAALVFVTSFVVAAIVSAPGRLIQRVEPAGDTASLFGDANDGPGVAIGSPQVYIIRDPRAFLPELGPNDERYVSETYLRERGIYPLQLKTVNLVRNLVAASSGLIALIAGALWWRLRHHKAPAIPG